MNVAGQGTCKSARRACNRKGADPPRIGFASEDASASLRAELSSAYAEWRACLATAASWAVTKATMSSAGMGRAK